MVYLENLIIVKFHRMIPFHLFIIRNSGTFDRIQHNTYRLICDALRLINCRINCFFIISFYSLYMKTERFHFLFQVKWIHDFFRGSV